MDIREYLRVLYIRIIMLRQVVRPQGRRRRRQHAPRDPLLHQSKSQIFPRDEIAFVVLVNTMRV